MYRAIIEYNVKFTAKPPGIALTFLGLDFAIYNNLRATHKLKTY